MALDKSDLAAIRTLMREEIKSEIEPFRKEVGQRFDQVDQRFEQVGQRFEQLESRFSQFQVQVDAQFTEVQSNFEALFARDDKREQENPILKEQIKRHDERIENLEKNVA